MMLKLLFKDAKRFWSKVNKSTGCWNWTAAKSKKGYGRFKLNGKLESPHVISYQLFYNEETKGKDVCHKCDNPSCVNPRHLFLGSRSDNMMDCSNKNRLYISQLKGINHPSSKLTEEDVLKIKELIPNHTLKEIGQMFNVKHQTISKIKQGKLWGHITKL